ncbi:MAG: C4-dicarboxylic acid transporter DauA [Marinobacter sp.]|uniref:C4-dicarboxylic acid transporter DauA n=1 Tax=Marinobacter sp. TaxID=50741 RepID=UPI001B52CE12|nr:C4-dicarboxylic acid transporter DauA [Marinobacter sp.]MBQ0745215.1 C4-dicarboxylic acid transporter DauA [Marinobacter sp.]MBQ0813159.1 C4-dicarboxylic acid transporter DauA [Marinobacter sp.]|tara:strand:- start:6751 stop:8520 length:1770 start_codon:yes stop_codon:yes gene_type:complete
MSHRAHLFSLRIAHAFREACIDQPYNSRRFLRDLMAGVTVGIIAIPLAMALAIASGVAPQYGLYTAFVAGFIIALTGGSRFSVSGPTAAFVVILYPIAQTYGLGGLLLATLMSGVLLIIMALMRLGRFIEYIPESVTLGFTGGIAVVIATLQVKDFFGLSVETMPEHYWDKLAVLAQSFPALDTMSALVAVVTLAVMLIWPRLKTPVPPHLPAVVIGSLLAIWLNANGATVETIGSRFSYLLPGGGTGAGIPPFLPEFAWPWQQADASGEAIGISWNMVRELLPAAFAIAMLGAIESLLCAVVLDGMTGKRHSANSELMGQGIGNIVVPFFGGITATAAIARSAANYRAGAESPVAAMIHAVVVLLALVSLAGVLAYLPMPAMAALLIMVAWNMSEAPKAVHLLKTAPRSDVLVFLTCFSLTVALDMVIAITTGVLLAAVLFMREMAEMTKVTDITTGKRVSEENLPAGWRVFKINGPMFFAAADRIFGELATLSRNVDGFILYMDGVTVLDAGGLSSLNKLIATCQSDGTRIVIADLQSQPQRTLGRGGLGPIEGVLQFTPSLREALALPLSSMAPQSSILSAPPGSN